MGDSIATNLFMVGYAYQRGLLPRRRGGDPARDRAERRGGRVEQAELPLGPPRRGRSGARRARRRCRSRDARIAAAVRVARRDRSTRRVEVPHRLPGRRVREALRRPRRARARRRGSARCPARPRSPRRSRATTSSCSRSRTSTRSRASTPRRDFAQRVAAQFEGDYKLTFHLAPPLFEQARSRRPASAKKCDLRPVDDDGVPRAREAAPLARHARSTSSAAPAERRMERALIGEYETLVDELARRARAAQPRARGRARADPRAHPRLRPRQGAAPEGREGERGGAARAVPRRAAATCDPAPRNGAASQPA